MPQFSKDLPIYIGFVHKLLVFINKIILSENVRMLLLTLNPQFLEASKPILRPKYELNYDKLHVSNTYKFTMNGWLISAKMLFSFLTCSTCLSRMTSAMASIFMAQYVLVVLSWHKHTRPNVPVPVVGETNKNRWERWKKRVNMLGDDVETMDTKCALQKSIPHHLFIHSYVPRELLQWQWILFQWTFRNVWRH